MSEQNDKNERHGETEFGRQVGDKAQRKLDAQRRVNKTIWFGFGWFGLIGWSVAAPALLGVFVGLSLDSRYPGPYSWTLMLFFAGLVLGCWNAWRWVSEEEARIHNKRDNEDE
ncbi:MAG: AtpZ/AtpI family protein [Gammaproteobacteria bacterium]